MSDLIDDPNIERPDDFYENLLKLHEGRTREESEAINARLVLLLANHVGDVSVLDAAMAASVEASHTEQEDDSATGDVTLYDYWRSSASYRVRIALNLAGLDHATVPVDLTAGEHKDAAHLGRNPQGLVPALQIGGRMLTQSLAIIEYLHDLHPETGLLPADTLGRARVRALSYAVAMEIHPICNMAVRDHVMQLLGGDEDARAAWMKKFIAEGFAGLERLLDHDRTGRFCHGDQPTMADCCLVPQVYNARRWNVDLKAFPHIRAIDAACSERPEFAAAVPEAVRAT
jgi:maleylacetoacetate isomerase